MTTNTASILLWALGLIPVAAQFSIEGSVLGAGGGTAAGTRYGLVSVFGQPPGSSATGGSTYTIIAGFLGVPILVPLLDTDGDGLPDELDADNDGDVQSDLFEVLANTGHNDFASRFSLVAQPVPGPEGQVLLVYGPTFSSRTYGVEWLLDLAQTDWAPLPDGDITVDGDQHVLKDENAGHPARKFYRIRIKLAP